MVIPLSSANEPAGSITVTANSARNGSSGLFLVIRNPDGSFRTNPNYVNLCPHSIDSGMVPKSFSHTYTGAFVENLSCCTLLLVAQLYRFPIQAIRIQDATIKFNKKCEAIQDITYTQKIMTTANWDTNPNITEFLFEFFITLEADSFNGNRAFFDCLRGNLSSDKPGFAVMKLTDNRVRFIVTDEVGNGTITDVYSTITMQAGVRYNIKCKIDYVNNSINVAVNNVYTTAVVQSAYNFPKPYQWLQGPGNVRIGSWGCCTPSRDLVDNKFTLEIVQCPLT